MRDTHRSALTPPSGDRSAANYSNLSRSDTPTLFARCLGLSSRSVTSSNRRYPESEKVSTNRARCLKPVSRRGSEVTQTKISAAIAVKLCGGCVNLSPPETCRRSCTKKKGRPRPPLSCGDRNPVKTGSVTAAGPARAAGTLPGFRRRSRRAACARRTSAAVTRWRRAGARGAPALAR